MHRSTKRGIIASLVALAVLSLVTLTSAKSTNQVTAETVPPTSTTTHPKPIPPGVYSVNYEKSEQRKLEALFTKNYNYNKWMATALFIQKTEEIKAAKAAALARIEARKRVSRQRPTRRAYHNVPQVQGSGRCGGNLPPCWVMNKESGGSLTAHNPTSSAAGKWQFLTGTWAGYGGYSTADQAPESVQDAKAAEVWANGGGCSHWSAC